MIFRTLQNQLLLTVGTLAIAAVGAVALSARHWTRLEFRSFQQLEMRTSVEMAGGRASTTAAFLDGRCCRDDVVDRAAEDLEADEALVVVDERGDLLAARGPHSRREVLRSIRTEFQADALTISGLDPAGHGARNTLRLRRGAGSRIRASDGRPLEVYVVPVPPPDAVAPAAVFLWRIDRRLVGIAGLVGILALALTWLIARRVVAPIAELGDAARDLARGNLSRRVDVQGPQEIAALAGSFNTMAAELEHQHAAQRRLLEDVAHELRTPLTALQCRLETMADGLALQPQAMLDDAVEAVRHLSRLFDDLEEIATAEARELRLSPGEVSIPDVVRSAVSAAGLADDPRISIDVASPLTALADTMRVRQVLVNLLANASRYTLPDGRITVRGRRLGEEVAIDVHNTGAALEPQDVQRIFDRFYRADPARQRASGGTGLGLAIVKHLVEAQGGRVSASSAADGVTLTFTLPAYREQHQRP